MLDLVGMGCRWAEQALKWNPTGVNRLAGSVAWLAGVLIQLTATQFVRRRWYSVSSLCHIHCVDRTAMLLVNHSALQHIPPALPSALCQLIVHKVVPHAPEHPVM